MSLELGGKSPYIVLDDVDIKEAAKATKGKVVNNTGQVCTAGTRILVPNSIKEEFLTALKEEFSQVVVGDPRNEDTEVGPIVSKSNLIRYNPILIKALLKAQNCFTEVLANLKAWMLAILFVQQYLSMLIIK